METPALEYVKKTKLDYEQNVALYGQFEKRLNFRDWPKSRLIILYGLRGSGKTTLMLQSYKENPKEKRIYIQAEEANLLRISIKDIVETAAYLFGGELYVYIDEISAIKGWAEEVKILYDKYPGISFVISGSSSLNLLESKKLLARRAYYTNVKALTFREYIHLRYGIVLDQFKLDPKNLKSAVVYDIYIKEKLGGKNLIQLVNEYIENNLPYLFNNPKSTLLDLVEKAIFFDVAKGARVEAGTIAKLERLILLLSASNKVTYENIAKDLSISKSMVSFLLGSLEQTGLIKRVYPYKSGKAITRKEWKYFFTVPLVRKLYAQKLIIPESNIAGNMLEDIFASNFEEIFFSEVDFVYRDMVIEIGSRNKGFGQVKRTSTELQRVVVYTGLAVEQSEGILKIPFYIFFSSV